MFNDSEGDAAVTAASRGPDDRPRGLGEQRAGRSGGARRYALVERRCWFCAQGEGSIVEPRLRQQRDLAVSSLY